MLEGQEVSPVNTDDLALALDGAEQRVLKIQTKLHRWARDDPHRRFDDLFRLFGFERGHGVTVGSRVQSGLPA